MKYIYIILCFTLTLFSDNLDEKIGQLIVVPICPTHGEQHIQSVCKLLKEKHIRNVIFMAGNSKIQKNLISTLEKEINGSLLTFQDAEWGVGMRLNDRPNFPKNITLGAIEDLQLLKEYGRELALQCKEVGIQVNTAPVVDINLNPKNPVIHRRSLGDDPQRVATQAFAIMQGMQEGGIYSCIKHFPGHGDTEIDSHCKLPVVNKPYWLMEQEELVPYKMLIEGGVDMIMVGHLLYPMISENPSSLSREILTDLLRNTLGFDGVIVSDALNMSALIDQGNLSEIFVKSLLAGTDFLLTASADPEEIKNLIEVAIPQAIEQIKRNVPESVIDEHLERILKMRNKTFTRVFSRKADLKKALYQNAITEIGKKKHFKDTIALVQNISDPDFETCLQRYAKVKIFSFEEMEFAEKYPDLLIHIQNEIPPSIPEHATVVLFDTPYRLNEFTANHILIGYENTHESKEALSDILFNQLNSLGKLPIHLCNE